MLQEAIRKHGEVLSKGGRGGNITMEGVGVPTGGVTGGEGGVKRVSSELEGGWKLKEAYPLICMIQKCLLACPPSQSDCGEPFSLLGLF